MFLLRNHLEEFLSWAGLSLLQSLAMYYDSNKNLKHSIFCFAEEGCMKVCSLERGVHWRGGFMLSTTVYSRGRLLERGVILRGFDRPFTVFNLFNRLSAYIVVDLLFFIINMSMFRLCRFNILNFPCGVEFSYDWKFLIKKLFWISFRIQKCKLWRTDRRQSLIVNSEYLINDYMLTVFHIIEHKSEQSLK